MPVSQHCDVVALECIAHHVAQVALKDLVGGLVWAENAIKVELLAARPVLDCCVIQDRPLASLVAAHLRLLLNKGLQSHRDVDVVVDRV